MDSDYQIYSLGQRFPDEKYISSEDCVTIRTSQRSFDVIMTLSNITLEERRAIISDKFKVSIFVHKQIPHIVFSFQNYKCNVSINIHKIDQRRVNDWMGEEESTVTIYLLEEVSGTLLNLRMFDFPLMTELKYLLALQRDLAKEEVDARICEAERLYSVQDMSDYSIFFGEVAPSNIVIIDREDEYIF